jgi:cell division protein FtsB
MFLFTFTSQFDLNMERLIALFRNKYFLAITFFVAWMIFFDKNDVLSQYDYHTEVNKLQTEKDFYTQEIKVINKDLIELDSDLTTAEKYAREKYFMKKENEDVFVIVKKDKEEDKE